MARLLAFLFFCAGMARIWFDWQETISVAEPFRFASVANVWDQLHSASLETTLDLTGRFDNVVPAVMSAPLVPVLLGLSVIFWMFRRKKR